MSQLSFFRFQAEMKRKMFIDYGSFYLLEIMGCKHVHIHPLVIERGIVDGVIDGCRLWMGIPVPTSNKKQECLLVCFICTAACICSFGVFVCILAWGRACLVFERVHYIQRLCSQGTNFP